MATISSIEFYLKRSGTTDFNAWVDVYNTDGGQYGTPVAGTLLGTTQSVQSDSMPSFDASPDWVSFSFATPLTVSNTGWYGIRLRTDRSSGSTAIRVYRASDWGTDDASAMAFKVASGWVGIVSICYRVIGTVNNVAETPGVQTDFSNSPNGYGLRSYLEGVNVPSKPTNPTPANEATEVDFSGFTLSWVDGGGATSYDVYIGPSGSLVKVSSSQAGTSYVTNIDEVPYNQVIYWRVDAVNSVGTTTGDTWHFDARPGAAITPYPGNATSGITLDDTTASWESGSDNTINYDIYFRPFGEFYELVDSDITDLSCTLYETNYLYGWLYFWSVVAKNKFGTYPESAPDGFLSDYEWYFNAMVFSPVLPTGVTMVDGKPASGTTGTPTGENNMMTTKRLVAAAQNKIWYEAI